MKKFLLVLFGITTMFGFNKVNAAEIRFEIDSNINEIKPFIDEIGYDKLNYAISKNIEYYNEYLSSNYPYYFISIAKLPSQENDYYIFLTAVDSTYLTDDYLYRYFDGSYYVLNQIASAWADARQVYYDFYTNSSTLVTYNDNGYSLDLFNSYGGKYVFKPYSYYYSNFDLYYRGSLYTESASNSPNVHISFTHNDNLLIPRYDNSSIYSVHPANMDFLVEPYYLYDTNTSLKEDAYTTIDLNAYEYVALTLKDYNTIPESNMSSYTYFYVKGQLCITPVYNYGLTERKDILTGTQIEGCSQYYNDFTANKVFILRDDVLNHAIYYLKAYDTSKDNIVKIDSNKFDITYITAENKDNPQVIIGGKTYPTLSYDSLTDTSTKSEQEGYVPGVSCTLGDLNCYIENNPENIFDEIFSSPLKFMQDVWDSVTSIFNVIVEFISLLPPQMQSFLYLSFMVAIILGLLKIIL